MMPSCCWFLSEDFVVVMLISLGPVMAVAVVVAGPVVVVPVEMVQLGLIVVQIVFEAVEGV
jgi:stringent starvation protein B